jgi:hypothetical protein
MPARAGPVRFREGVGMGLVLVVLTAALAIRLRREGSGLERRHAA